MRCNGDLQSFLASAIQPGGSSGSMTMRAARCGDASATVDQQPPKRQKKEAVNENVENLILENLKRFQAGQDRIERKIDEHTQRLGRIEVAIASVSRAGSAARSSG